MKSENKPSIEAKKEGSAALELGLNELVQSLQNSRRVIRIINRFLRRVLNLKSQGIKQGLIKNINNFLVSKVRDSNSLSVEKSDINESDVAFTNCVTDISDCINARKIPSIEQINNLANTGKKVVEEWQQIEEAITKGKQESALDKPNQGLESTQQVDQQQGPGGGHLPSEDVKQNDEALQNILPEVGVQDKANMKTAKEGKEFESWENIEEWKRFAEWEPLKGWEGAQEQE